MSFISFLSEKYNNFVFIGGSGSGKSVISVNTALTLAAEGTKPVHFFDLDQTKAMFRSRDFDSLLLDNGVIVHSDSQFMDAPSINIGVSKFLLDPGCITIIDVGGDDRGAVQIGQFSRYINTSATLCLYVMNPYRPWSTSDTEIYETVSAILRASRVSNHHVLANPNLGQETVPNDVVNGYWKLKESLGENESIFACCVNAAFYDEIAARIDVPIIEVKHFVRMYWD